MDSKMKSLSEFTISQNEMKKTTGGYLHVSDSRHYMHRVEVVIPTRSIGTYVDGFSMGTDGYQD